MLLHFLVKWSLSQQFAFVYAHAFYCSLEADLAIRNSDNLLVKYILDTLFGHIELRAKFITAAKGCFVVQCHFRHDEVIAFCAHIGKAKADGEEEFVAGMLQIVLVVGIIDNALKVAFVVAYLHQEFITEIFHRAKVIKRLEIKIRDEEKTESVQTPFF